MNWLTRLYDNTLNENRYIFAHFFLAMIISIILAMILAASSGQQAYQIKWHCRMAILFIGVVYEVIQHRTGAEKGLKGSIQDVVANQLGCENLLALYY